MIFDSEGEKTMRVTSQEAEFIEHRELSMAEINRRQRRFLESLGPPPPIVNLETVTFSNAKALDGETENPAAH